MEKLECAHCGSTNVVNVKYGHEIKGLTPGNLVLATFDCADCGGHAEPPAQT